MVDAAPDHIRLDSTLLRLLDCIAKDGVRSQRVLAAEVGIALGLVNTYLNSCVQKGLLKVAEAPAKRYGYYLTSLGFAEKARLTLEYLSSVLSLFRTARADMVDLLKEVHGHGTTRVALLGLSELTKIAVVSSYDGPVKTVAIADANGNAPRIQFLGVPMVSSDSRLLKTCDSATVTVIADAGQYARKAAEHWAADRLFAPTLTRLSLSIDNVLQAAGSARRRAGR